MDIRKVVDGVLEAKHSKATTAEANLLACELLLKEFENTTPHELQKYLVDIQLQKKEPKCTITLSFPLVFKEPMLNEC
ncbi:hypothetical protein ACTHOQ_13995 [Solibacillus silvestris]|uniref:hypothetical protein n=1 Tax=Solibacillus silvestris TaxID=76853 RepID=UPI003F7D0F49